MSEFSKLVQNLRETTNCGINDCKRALKYNNNDLHKSYEWLKNPYRSWEHNHIDKLNKMLKETIPYLEQFNSISDIEAERLDDLIEKIKEYFNE